jgi:FkbM family methyltransferase
MSVGYGFISNTQINAASRMPPVLLRLHYSGGIKVYEQELIEIAGFRLIVERGRYSPAMVEALRASKYEGEEQKIAPQFIESTDRILEMGTAIGLITMIAARIVGCEHILTFDANQNMAEDARRNFALNNMPITARTGIMQNRSKWSPGHTEFHIDRNFWSSSLIKTSTTVETVMATKLCLEKEILDFEATALICDIEGGEADLFPGSDLMGVNKIMMETHSKKVGQSAIHETVRSIQRQGFSIDYANSWGGIVCLYRGF